jgi:hypothetical protein
MASLTTGAVAGLAVDVCVAGGFAVDGVAGGFEVDCVVGGFAVDGVVAGGFAVEDCATRTISTDGSIRLTAVARAMSCRAFWKRVLAAI